MVLSLIYRFLEREFFLFKNIKELVPILKLNELHFPPSFREIMHSERLTNINIFYILVYSIYSIIF